MAESFNQDSLTLEETNKVRISLGLAPIGGDVDAAGAGADGAEDSLADQADVAEANYAERRAAEKRAREEAEIKERIEKSRNRVALNAKLKGSTLADAGKDDALSAKSWLKQQKKRAKRHAEDALEKKRREQEEQDAMVYDERDLAGLKVAHGADDFETGEDVVLTLKDSRVLGDDEDELQNVNLADYAADAAHKERKRKAAEQYTGYDDDEFEEGRVGRKAEILGKYDDAFATGKVRTEGFRLGAPVEKKQMVKDDDVEMIGAPASKVKLDLNFAKDFEVSDYMKEGDKGFKVKKKKVKRSTRRAEADDDGESIEVDVKLTFERRQAGDGPDNLVDDDDLQAALSRARRENARTRVKAKPEGLAAQLALRREEGDAEQDTAPADGDDDGRITFDDTSEFVRNVTAESRAITAASSRPSRAVSAAPNEPVVVQIESRAAAAADDEANGDGDEAMDVESEDEDEALAEMAAREGLSLAEYRLKIDAQLDEIDKVQAEGAAAAADGDGGDDEPVPTGSGVAGVLALLRNQGALKARTAADDERERVQKQRDLWLADHRRRMAQRELERIQARGGNKDQAQREWENRMREQQEAREALDAYKDYKPDIHIVYHDEFGREMTPKEAWKSLSHKFHGKTSGRMKAAKRIKKIEEEQKARSMASSDTPLGMSNAFQRRQEKTGEAFMVLSVGNKGSVQETKGKGKARR
ncbi:hypothetical protein Q5752_006825 [Cryptotrichosporon argae]